MPDSLIKLWGLSGVKLLTETHTSYVYKAVQNGCTVVLKHLKPAGIDDERHGAAALAHFDGLGAVRLFASTDEAMLLEFADGMDVKAVVMQGDDDKATHIIAQTLSQLHSKPVPSDITGFITLERRFLSLFEKAKSDNGFYSHAASIARKLLDTSQDIRVLHGDIHHENILFSPRGWLAIDPKGLVGERTYDAANILCNPAGMDDFVCDPVRISQRIKILCAQTGMDTGRLRHFAFAYTALSAAWSLEDGHNPALALRLGGVLEGLLK